MSPYTDRYLNQYIIQPFSIFTLVFLERMACECDFGVFICVGLHDLEGAVGSVEELDLADAPLRHGVERRAAPAPLQQADGLGCETEDRGLTVVTVGLCKIHVMTILKNEII